MANQTDILALIAQGESITLEFKTCEKKLNKDVYDTVCAFLNRHGGIILLGVTDDGEVQGINSQYISQIRKDFVTTINNGQKIYPPAYATIQELEIGDKHILRIDVQESPDVHRRDNFFFDRNEDGDLNITKQNFQMANLFARKSKEHTEDEIFPHVQLSDLDAETLKECRQRAVNQRQNHPWSLMSDLELLKSAKLYQTNPSTQEEGVTLAGILLLGTEDTILSALSHHRTDLLVRRVNLDRYDDRDFVTVNLVQSFDRVMDFVQKHLSDPFYLEGTQRISIRDAIFREVASNILIHREYTNPFPAKLIIEQGAVRTENANISRGTGKLDPHHFTPMPKNPNIAKFFREIGLADELGSGMRNLMKYGQAYGGEIPQLLEGDVFRIVVQTPNIEHSPQVIPPSHPSRYCPVLDADVF